ncbi:hypothetical protein HYU13_03830 [Candidatus Woesearchaeota archaeon]|nr:hypothetical protein [Candidatus Woesearchaeota archaeon]
MAVLDVPRIKSVSRIAYFTHGKRGNLYTGIYNGRKVAIKSKRPESEALGRIENEIRFLKILNEKGIGPKLLFWDKRKFSYFAYHFVEGMFFPEFIGRCKKKDRKKILGLIKGVLEQCFTMDKLGIAKEEMSHPTKHIIIGIGARKPVLIDFERCHHTEKPGNVTQFCSYLLSGFIAQQLGSRGVALSRRKMIRASKIYKKNVSRKNLDALFQCFANHHLRSPAASVYL